LLPGSPAIGAAGCSQPADQRGFPRPGAGKTTCDAGAYETGATAPLAKWYSDGGVAPSFLQQDGFAPDPRLGTCAGLRTITGDFNGDNLADVLAYCPSTGAFQKLYGTGGTGSQFAAQPIGYVHSASGAWTNIQMVAADFNGDGKTDIMVYRTDNGAYAKWFSDGGVDAGFIYQPIGYVANAPGAWTNIQMVAADFNGDGKTDIMVYRTDNGAYAKWYSDGGIDAGFIYQPIQYVGGASGAWTDVVMVPTHFTFYHSANFLVYRPDTGAFQKWYGSTTVGYSFFTEPTQYVGNAPGAWTNIQMVPADFDGDGLSDILVYRTDTGAFQKWYTDRYAQAVAGFIYEPIQYVGGARSAWTGLTMVAADFNNDGKADLLVSHT
jgi:hypothetical protein